MPYHRLNSVSGFFSCWIAQDGLSKAWWRARIPIFTPLLPSSLWSSWFVSNVSCYIKYDDCWRHLTHRTYFSSLFHEFVMLISTRCDGGSIFGMRSAPGHHSVPTLYAHDVPVRVVARVIRTVIFCYFSGKKILSHKTKIAIILYFVCYIWCFSWISMFLCLFFRCVMT